MTDYVSVDPPRVKALADALQKGASDLPEAKSSIKNLISGWEGTWDSSKVEELITFLAGNYHAMQDRADLAATAAHQTVATNLGDPKADWRGIPWNVTPAVKAQEGMQDAANLDKGINSDDEATRVAAQKELANALETHAGDPDWTAAFLKYGGSQVVVDGNESVINHELPPSEEAKKLLTDYANGTAALTTYAETDGNLPKDALAPFYDKANVVPLGVMMKYGPSGKSYGTTFLTNVGKTALDWRADHQEPKYEIKVLQGTGVVRGVDQSDDDWWTDYGINIDLMDAKPSELEDAPLITEYDPVQGILNRVGDDHVASNNILTGKDGPHYADIVTSPRWTNFVSGGAAKIISSGTNRLVDGKAGAEAAANVFEQAYKQSEKGDQGTYGYDPTIARAMSEMAAGYTGDLARSTESGDPDLTAVVDGKDGPEIQTNRAVINGFLKLLSYDPTATGNFQGAVDAQVQVAATVTAKWPNSPETTNLLYQSGYLKGMVQVAASDKKYEAAAAQDATNARNKAFTDATVGILASIPGAGDAAKFIINSGRAIYSASGGYIFPVDNAANAGREAQYTTARGADDLDIPTAQGVLQSGTYPLPDKPSFVHGGVISPQSEDELAQFQNWWSKRPDELANRLDGRAGYDDATSAKSTNDDSYDPPS